jgi:hypothetical protein
VKKRCFAFSEQRRVLRPALFRFFDTTLSLKPAPHAHVRIRPSLPEPISHRDLKPSQTLSSISLPLRAQLCGPGEEKPDTVPSGSSHLTFAACSIRPPDPTRPVHARSN